MWHFFLCFPAGDGHSGAFFTRRISALLLEFHVILEDGSIGINNLSIEGWFSWSVKYVSSVIPIGFWIQVFLLLHNFQLIHIVFEVHSLDQPILFLLQVRWDKASIFGDSVSVPVVSLVIGTFLVELAGGV